MTFGGLRRKNFFRGFTVESFVEKGETLLKTITAVTIMTNTLQDVFQILRKSFYSSTSYVMNFNSMKTCDTAAYRHHSDHDSVHTEVTEYSSTQCTALLSSREANQLESLPQLPHHHLSSSLSASWVASGKSGRYE